MSSRGPGFLAIVLFGSSPSHPSASCLSFSVFLCDALVELTDGRGGGRRGWGGAKSYDDEKAWSSINHSILSPYGYLL